MQTLFPTYNVQNTVDCLQICFRHVVVLNVLNEKSIQNLPHHSQMRTFALGAQSYSLFTVNAHAVALPLIHAKRTQHYSRYCAVAFCYVLKCELSHISWV